MWPLLSLLAAQPCIASAPSGDLGSADARFDLLTGTGGRFDGAERQSGTPMAVVRGGRPALSVRLAGGTSPVTASSVGLLRKLVGARTGVRLPDAGPARGPGGSIVVLTGDDPVWTPRLRAAGFAPVAEVGPQGFVVQRLMVDEEPCMVVWSPHPVGCRYGVLELARSLRFSADGCTTDLERVVSRPFFPYRAYYLNFAEHLQNRYNVNVVFDTPENQWTLPEWERLIDMIAAMRYSVFQFWLIPSLFSPDALSGGPVQARFASTMRQVIDYAHSRGLMVEFINGVNTVGSEWRYYCPHVPEEREMILRLWDHWTRELSNADIVGLFPGDPGGCTRNGCDYRTYVNLCLAITERTRRNGDFIYEVNTWGTPFWGWGVEGWEGTPQRARDAFDYFADRLDLFPRNTYVGLCMGLNPDAAGDSHGGDSRPYFETLRRIRPVTTWDYGTSEGEMTVIPRFRLPRIIDRRQAEAERGYVGGINYTMTPALNQLQPFAAAECYWDPERTVDGLLADYSRLAFGDEAEMLAGRVFPYVEVVGDWGGGGWSGGLSGLAERLGAAEDVLAGAAVPAECALSLFPSPAAALEALLWHVGQERRLAEGGAAIEEVLGLIRELGGPEASAAFLADAEDLAKAHASEPSGVRLAELIGRIRTADFGRLREEYWKRVYGIYDSIARPVDPRSWGATDALFARFHADFVTVTDPSRLEAALRERGEPYLNLDLGNAASERRWQLAGWSGPDMFDGENWRTSGDLPAVARLAGFVDRGYGYLALRVTDDTVGGSKRVEVNGVYVGTYVRPAKRLEWTTQVFPLPEGLLSADTLEIVFREPGVAISDVALTISPPPTGL